MAGEPRGGGILKAILIVIAFGSDQGSCDQDMGVLFTLECSGQAVASVADLNADGVDDIVGGEGAVYVFSGLDGEVLRTLNSPSSGAAFGWSLNGVEDLDGDGWAEVIVGAPLEEPDSCLMSWDSGRAYVFRGQDGDLLHTLQSPNEEENGRFGWAVTGIGNVDRDGIEDLAVGTPYEDPAESPGEAGRVHVYSGSSGELLYTLGSPNEEFYGFFGRSICGGGDIDGDGLSEIVIGAYAENCDPVLIDAGRVYIFSGATGEVLYSLVSPNAEWSGYFGYSIARTADIDGDALADLLIGAPWEDPGQSPGLAGRAYVVSASTGALIHELSSPNEEWNGLFGRSVAAIGDIDEDGVGDLAVGAPREDPGESPRDAGRVYLFSGSDGELLYTLTSPNEGEDGYFGHAISGFPMEDRDHFSRVIVGASGERNNLGRVYAFGMVTRTDQGMGQVSRGFTLTIALSPGAAGHARVGLVIPSDQRVTVSIYDLLGKEVRNLYRGLLLAGTHWIVWDGLVANGKQAASGAYICHAKGQEGEATRRLVFIR